MSLWTGKYPEHVITGKEMKLVKDLLAKSGKSAQELFALVIRAQSKKDEKKYWNCVHRSKTIPQFVPAYNEIMEELGKDRSQRTPAEEAKYRTRLEEACKIKRPWEV